MKIFLVLTFFIFLVKGNFWHSRIEFLNKEENLRLGSNITLNIKEKMANIILMEIKKNEISHGLQYPTEFGASKHFFNGGKELIEKTQIFNIIRRMPKGGILHVHDASILTSDWLVKNVTYRHDLYLNINNDTGEEIWNFKFMENPKDGWELVRELRKGYEKPEDFDSLLYSKLTMKTNYPHYDINSAWKDFEKIFGLVTPMITFRPVFLDYFHEVMLHFLRDNVQYIELRINLPEVYELDGKIWKPNEVVELIKNVADEFVSKYPDFYGLRIIYTANRNSKNLEEHIQLFQQLQSQFPGFVLGFDLVGQETDENPLANFANIITKDLADVKKVFHAGETNWLGTTIDNNILDAVLLNTTRIGHGYAINRHPLLIQEIKNRNIAVELCPISNQILMLNGPDFRNHPGGSLIAQGVPCVISSDGSSFWDALPASHDFYMTFIGLASMRDDLRLLKQLALNSINYSLLPSEEKDALAFLWMRKWDEFLNYLIGLKRSSYMNF